MEHEYEGIPIAEIRIDRIRWTDRIAEHIRTRKKRKASEGEIDLEPEWATEAALDPKRIVAGTGGESIEVIGWSKSAEPAGSVAPGLFIKVWLIPEDLSEGAWLGTSACAANKSDRRAYEEVNR